MCRVSAELTWVNQPLARRLWLARPQAKLSPAFFSDGKQADAVWRQDAVEYVLDHTRLSGQTAAAGLLFLFFQKEIPRSRPWNVASASVGSSV